MQRGGFVSEQDARESLERALERVRRANGTGTTLTLAGLVDEDLAQHDAQRETIEKLRWLLAARMLLVQSGVLLDVRMRQRPPGWPGALALTHDRRVELVLGPRRRRLPRHNRERARTQSRRSRIQAVLRCGSQAIAVASAHLDRDRDPMVAEGQRRELWEE